MEYVAILIAGIWQALRHHNHDHVFFRIDPKYGCRNSTPVVLAVTCREANLGGISYYALVQTESLPRTEFNVIA